MIKKQQHPDGYALLKALRAYLNLTMYAWFNVHTMETIVAGEKALEAFSASMKVHHLIIQSYHEILLTVHLLVSRHIKLLQLRVALSQNA